MRWLTQIVIPFISLLTIAGCLRSADNNSSSLPANQEHQEKENKQSVEVNVGDDTYVIEFNQQPYQPLERKKAVIITLIHSPDSPCGIRVYGGDEIVPESEMIVQSERDLSARIRLYVEKTVSENPNLNSVSIESSGKVSTGIVEIVKSAVNESNGQAERRLYVGFHETKMLCN